jgi:uncharacterized membrane protein YkvA (DUF1232 family)
VRFLETWGKKARQLKNEVYALYLACRDPRVPWYAKLFALCVVSYALSPVDLIPDFIPILGYVDDLILLPIAIALVIKMIPGDVLNECRQKAEAGAKKSTPGSRIAASCIIALWILAAWLVISWWLRR